LKQLHFDYQMEIRYGADISRCFYTIKCIPRSTLRQRISGLTLAMTPENTPEWGLDSHGNRYIFGCNEAPHDYFRFRVSGDAECGLSEAEEKTSETEEMIFRHSSPLTAAGPRLGDFYAGLLEGCPGFAGLTPFEKAGCLSDSLNQVFRYEKNSTDVSTSAEAAFAQGRGVCQDYAHILISLLNLAGCSARYVTGLLIGEGVSHAWVEVADGGFWRGLDPTNRITVTDSHIRIGCGRDASECLLNRGVMHGRVAQEQKVSVSVTEKSLGQKYIPKGGLF